MEEHKSLGWFDAIGLAHALLGAAAVASLVAWSAMGLFWPLVGQAARSFLHDNPDAAIFAGVMLGMPAAVGLCTSDQPNPTFEAICIGLLVIGFLALAAGAAATCDGPFLWLGGGACC